MSCALVLTRRSAVLLAACLAMPALTACQRPRTSTAYFPLQAGSRSPYGLVIEATEEMDQPDEPLEMTVESLGPEDLAGARVTRQQIDRDGATYVLFMGVD